MSKRQRATEVIPEPTATYWVVTGAGPKKRSEEQQQTARQVYPTEAEATRYATQLKRKPGWSDVHVNPGRPR